ncbi:MAG: hypothetical protein JW720_12360 [Sedimentisphaerales bacterium]|nr:hypothetical protein [Sedimentisphaerales bacterium]
MLLTKRQFDVLCERYALSPTQKRIARLILEGKTTDLELCRSLKKEPKNIRRQMTYMLTKTFCRNRTDLVLRFWADAQDISPYPGSLKDSDPLSPWISPKKKAGKIPHPPKKPSRFLTPPSDEASISYS